MIQEIKVPTETVTEIKDDKTHEVERKLYPGYVFIKMVYTDETWYVVRNIRAVSYTHLDVYKRQAFYPACIIKFVK